MVDLDFFASPIGLGHVARDVAIAENFKGVLPRFVTGGSAAQFLKKAGFGAEDLYRPPRFVVENGSLKNPARWLWSYYQYYKECKSISEGIIRADSPRVVVSDEDFASLAVAQEMGIPTVLITDVLETRFTRGIAALVEKKMNRSMKEIIGKCDAVIIPEDGEDCGNIKRTGPVVRQTGLSREELREKFAFGKKTVLVSVGGTDAGAFLIERALEAVPKMGHEAEVVVVSGPSLKKVSGRDGGGGDGGDGTRYLGFVDNLHELIFAADVLVSLAGKSTIDEANAYGTPGIFIPVKDHFEQEDNAREEGFVFEDVDRLADLVSEKLMQGRKDPVAGSGGAASAATRIITGLL